LLRKPVAALLLVLAPTPALAALPAFDRAGFASPERSLGAPIALMVDVNSGRTLFSRDARRRFIPASLTKIMTAYVAFELIAEGRLDQRQRFLVRPETFREWSGKGTSMFLQNGTEVAVADLLRGIVTVSANDACVVLAEGASGSVANFTALMNAKARELGMRDSHFNTPNGWPDEGQTYVSAADLATLSTALINRHPDLYARYFGHPEMTWNGITQRNRNPLYGAVAGADGVKTGHTNEAGYDFVGSAVRHGRRVVMVVAGYDRPQDRRDQSRAFVEWAFSAWQGQRLFEPGDQVATAQVQGGEARTVALAAPRSLFVTLPKGARPVYGLAVRYKGPLQAPIAKGQQVGTLVVRMQGEKPVELPLVAGSAVAEGGLGARIWFGLLGLLGL
jgi:D-alanyl-D-alanine carboxypeptidase (penicillin-binding protein 5/6)